MTVKAFSSLSSTRAGKCSMPPLNPVPYTSDRRSHVRPLTYCNRQAVWGISGVGLLCNAHFELYFESHPETPLRSIHRLSENERLFSTGHDSPHGQKPTKIYTQSIQPEL
jgi:hypothetical protein